MWGIRWKSFLAYLTFFSMLAVRQNKSSVLYQELYVTWWQASSQTVSSGRIYLWPEILQRECFHIDNFSKSKEAATPYSHAKFPFIWPSHLSICNCFLLLVWWWSRLHKHCLTGKIRMISQWLKGNLCEITGNKFFSPRLLQQTK